ncbi:ATP-dependent RNA helicase RhlE, partial [Pseudomonas sp. S 311-6]|nr:ATP-dependent RNA helicase RhlE [Pseudomonas sp. S 311-6]
TKHGANRLAEKLVKDGLSAAAIHGNKSQSARTRALDGFKSGDVAVLVATDIAARGLDIDQLPQVINFELPNVPEDYVHRIGRTGRAGAAGSAISLVDGEEIKLLKAIEKLIRRPIEQFPIPDWTPPAVTEPADPREERDLRNSLGRGRGGPAPRRSQPGQRSGDSRPRSAGPGGNARSGGGNRSSSGVRRSGNDRGGKA